MSTPGGEHTNSDSYERAPEHYEVLAVPQIPGYSLSGYYYEHLEEIHPTHEVLSLVKVSDGPNEADPAPTEKPDALAPAKVKQAWVDSRFPPHKPEEVPFVTYDPAEHRRARDAQSVNELFEWVTVVTDNKLYLGLNDDEFDALSEALKPEGLVVLGQALRPRHPDSKVLRSGYSLLELFGADESGQLQS